MVPKFPHTVDYRNYVFFCADTPRAAISMLPFVRHTTPDKYHYQSCSVEVSHVHAVWLPRGPACP